MDRDRFQAYSLHAGPDPIDMAAAVTHRDGTEDGPRDPDGGESGPEPPASANRFDVRHLAGAIAFAGMFIGVAIKDFAPGAISVLPSVPVVEAVGIPDEPQEELLSELEVAARLTLGGKELPPRIRASFLRIEAERRANGPRGGDGRLAAGMGRSIR